MRFASVLAIVALGALPLTGWAETLHFGGMTIYPVEEAPISQKVADSLRLGAVISRGAFEETHLEFVRRARTTSSSSLRAAANQSAEQVLLLRDIAHGRKVVVQRNGAVLTVTRHWVAHFEKGFAGYGLRLPSAGWELTDGVFGSTLLGKEGWTQEPSQIVSGRWMGAYRARDGSLWLAGLKAPPVSGVARPRERVHQKSASINSKAKTEKSRGGPMMVRVPAGPFGFGTLGYIVSAPETTKYWIDAYEVSNRRYAEFVQATGRPAPTHWKGQEPLDELQDHPVVHVDWVDAGAYCTWAGMRLPSVKEWEKAARGDLDLRVFPWGDEEPEAGKLREFVALGSGTVPVQTRLKGVSPYGVHHMIGNVEEWTSSPLDERLVGVLDSYHTRGGSWDDLRPEPISPKREIGSAPSSKRKGLGFRCVRDDEPSDGPSTRPQGE